MPPVMTRRNREDRQRLVAFLQAQQPRHGDDEKGLQEFRRLDLANAELDPALGAVMLGPEDRHEDQKHEEERRAGQRQPPRPLARHHRDADHHRHAERDPRQLAPEIIKLGEADVAARIALAGGGRGGGDRDQPDRRSAPRPAAAGPCRSPRTSGRSRWCRSGRNGSGSISAALALILPEMLSIITPPPARGTGRRAPRSRETGRSDAHAGDSSTVSPASASAAALPHRFLQRHALCHGHVRRQERSEQFARFANGIGLADMAEVRRAFVEIVGLGLPAADPADVLERGERGRGRGRVGRLAVVDEERRRPSRGCAPCGGQAGIGAEGLRQCHRLDTQSSKQRWLRQRSAALCGP